MVRHAESEDLGRLLELARVRIGGGLATEATVRRVMARRSDSLWSFSDAGRIVGGLAMLLLNRAGAKALLAGSINPSDPADTLLAGPTEAPAAIYVWAVAQAVPSGGVEQVFARLQSSPYRTANVYAVPSTLAGRLWMQGWGFKPIPGHPRNLHRYVRWANRHHQPGRE